MALLQGGKRTATVRADRRSYLLAVDKPAFDQLFLKNPKAIEYFARVLSKRLAGVTRAERIRRATTTISVASPHGLKGETVCAFTLAVLLKQLTRTEVVYVEVRPSDEAADPTVLDLLADSLSSAAGKYTLPQQSEGPTHLKITVPNGLDEARYGDLLSNLASRLSDQFSFIVLDLGSGVPGLIQSAPAYSDVFVTIVDSPDDETGIRDPRSMKVYKVINLFNPTIAPAADQQQRAVRHPVQSDFRGVDGGGEPADQPASAVRGGTAALPARAQAARHLHRSGARRRRRIRARPPRRAQGARGGWPARRPRRRLQPRLDRRDRVRGRTAGSRHDRHRARARCQAQFPLRLGSRPSSRNPAFSPASAF